MSYLRKLYVQVFIAVLLGVVFGYFFPQTAVQFKPIIDIFIKMIKVIIAPIIFLTLVTGISAMHDLRRVSTLAGGALLYFFLVTSFALILGLTAADLLKPGVGLNIDPTSLDIKDASAYISSNFKATSLTELILNIVPRTFVSAFVDGELLQVIFISLLFSIGLLLSGDLAKPIVTGMQNLSKVFFKMIHLIMHLAPLASFSAMAYSIGKFGLTPLFHLGSLLLCYYLTSLLFILVIMGGILHLYCRINIWQLILYFKDELLIVLGTASSETVLPNLMEKLEILGCEKSIVGLVLPLGYSFNLAGTALYLTLTAMFIAQATNTNLSLWQEVSLLSVMIISSKGAAGVSGSGFIILASSLAALNIIPPAGVILVLGIDKFLNEGRTIINVLNNVIATIILSVWQKAFHYDKAIALLNKEPEKEDIEPQDYY